MIFTHRKRWIRILSSIPALFILGAIIFVYYAFMTELIVPILTSEITITEVTGQYSNGEYITIPRVFTAGTGTIIFTIVWAIVVNTFAGLTLWSFFRTVVTDAGTVPMDYINRHRGLIRLYRLQTSSSMAVRFQTYNNNNNNNGNGNYRTIDRNGQRSLSSNLPGFLRGQVSSSSHASSTSSSSSSATTTNSYRSSNNNYYNYNDNYPQNTTTEPTDTDKTDTNVHSSDDSTILSSQKTVSSDTVVSIPSSSSTSSTTFPAIAALPAIGERPSTIIVHHIHPSLIQDPSPFDPRYCKKCSTVKPPRTHHCSLCGRCVTKMDHHCPWVANCVGYNNYKYFYLLLVHGFVSCVLALCLWSSCMFSFMYPLQLKKDTVYDPNSVYSSPASFERALKDANEDFNFTHGEMLGMFGFILCLSLTASLIALGGMHTYLILYNKTTLESGMSGSSPYSKGIRNNWLSVMGINPFYWFLPILTKDVDNLTMHGTDYRRTFTESITRYPVYEYPIPVEEEEQDWKNSIDQLKTKGKGYELDLQLLRQGLGPSSGNNNGGSIHRQDNSNNNNIVIEGDDNAEDGEETDDEEQALVRTTNRYVVASSTTTTGTKTVESSDRILTKGMKSTYSPTIGGTVNQSINEDEDSIEFHPYRGRPVLKIR